MADRNTNVVITAEDRTRAAIESARRNLAGLESSFTSLNSLAGRLPVIGAALGAAFSAASITGLVKGAIDLQDKFNDLSKTTRLTVEQIAGLDLLARQSGTNVEDLGKAVNILAREMGKAPDKFRALGVTARDPIAALGQFADVMNGIEDPQRRAAVASIALGRAWETIAPALAEGGKGMKEIVDKGAKLSGITADSAKRADEFNDRLAELQARASGWAIKFADPIVSGFLRIAEEIDRARGPLELFLASMRAAARIGSNVFRVLPFGDRVSTLIQATLDATAAKPGAGRDTGNRTIAPPKTPDNAAFDAFIGREKEKAPGKSLLRLRDASIKAVGDLPANIADSGLKGLDRIIERFDEAQSVIESNRTPLEKLEATYKRLNDLLASGALLQEDYDRATLRAQQDFEEATKKAGNALDEFAKNAAENIQSSLADFLFDPFEHGLRGMADGFSALVRRMVAEAAAADLTRYLFGKVAGGSGQGLLGGILETTFGSVLGGLFGSGTQAAAPVTTALTRNLPGRAEGGPVMAGQAYWVGERGPEIFRPGVSGAIVPNHATRQTVQVTNVFHVPPALDARSQQQIALSAGRGVQRALARNG